MSGSIRSWKESVGNQRSGKESINERTGLHQTLIKEIRELGCTLQAEGESLRVRPASLLTDELRGAIREHKAAILALICSTCGEPLTVKETPTYRVYTCAVDPNHRTRVENARPGLPMGYPDREPGECSTCGGRWLLYGGQCSVCLQSLAEAEQRQTARIFTAGYAGAIFGQFKTKVEEIDALVIDIRFSPVSKLAAWTHSALKRELGARYRHVGALGNKNFDRKDQPIEIADLQTGIEVIQRIEQPVILLCGCREFGRCHRRVIAVELERLGYKTEELTI